MLKLHDLYKVYRTDEVETVALNGVNFEVNEGDFVAVMGPSGCGKSTLLRMVAGLEEISQGDIAIDGKVVNQLEIIGYEKRIPDGILYINGLPLVVFEFKSAIREEATIHDAYKQLTIRYRRDIPELLKYNALCIISDGVNSCLGSLFAAYEHFSAWRKITGNETQAQDGISSLHTRNRSLPPPHFRDE